MLGLLAASSTEASDASAASAVGEESDVDMAAGEQARMPSRWAQVPVLQATDPGKQCEPQKVGALESPAPHGPDLHATDPGNRREPQEAGALASLVPLEPDLHAAVTGTRREPQKAKALPMAGNLGGFAGPGNVRLAGKGPQMDDDDAVGPREKPVGTALAGKLGRGLVAASGPVVDPEDEVEGQREPTESPANVEAQLAEEEPVAPWAEPQTACGTLPTASKVGLAAEGPQLGAARTDEKTSAEGDIGFGEVLGALPVAGTLVLNACDKGHPGLGAVLVVAQVAGRLGQNAACEKGHHGLEVARVAQPAGGNLAQNAACEKGYLGLGNFAACSERPPVPQWTGVSTGGEWASPARAANREAPPATGTRLGNRDVPGACGVDVSSPGWWGEPRRRQRRAGCRHDTRQDSPRGRLPRGRESIGRPRGRVQQHVS